MDAERATAGPPPAGDGTARPDNAFLALIRIPVFRRLWAAIAVSSLGDWLGLLATTAMAQQLTRDESLAVQGAAISGVILTRLLPDLVLGPLAGAARLRSAPRPGEGPPSRAPRSQSPAVRSSGPSGRG